jgi:hypothetical protein
MSAGDSEKSIEMLVLLVETQQKFESLYLPEISSVRCNYVSLIVIIIIIIYSKVGIY